MEGNTSILSITSKDLSDQKLHDEESFDPAKALVKFDNAKKAYISLPGEVTPLLLEEVLKTKKFSIVIAEAPISYNYFDIQKLVFTEKDINLSKIFVNSPIRYHSKVRELKQQIQEVLEKGAKLSSVVIESTRPLATSSWGSDSKATTQFLKQGMQDIDLLLHLTGQDVSVVQGLSSQSGDEKSTVNGFITLSTKLTSGAQGTVLLRSQEGLSSTNVRIHFSNQKDLQISIENPDSEQNDKEGQKDINKIASQDEADFISLKEAAKVVRIYECADEALQKEKTIYLKHVTKEVTPFRSVGTAVFLDIGLFNPSHPNKKVAVTGLYSKKEDKIKKIFKKETRKGEPLEFAPDFDKLIDVHYDVPSKPAIYIPSIPGDRKNEEMIKAVKKGFIVFAEKPAFTSAYMGRSFHQQLEPEWKNRIFFGWHYQHHSLYERLLKDISKQTFGKVKHVKTSFTDPKLYIDANSRIFDPSQGGVGLDIYSYNLHFTLRLIGFEHDFEVVESKITTAEHLDPKKPELKEIDLIIDSKVKFSNGVLAELYANFSGEMTTRSQAEIHFEDGTKLFCKENIHFNQMTSDGTHPIVIQKPGSKRWEEYVPDDEMEGKEILKSTYEQQVEFIRKQAAGEEKYDMEKDEMAIGVVKNIRFHEILDKILEKGGIKPKSGA